MPTKVVDTTGAGDAYAAGFLAALTAGHALPECGRWASVAAAEAISHFGARPQADLKALVAGGGAGSRQRLADGARLRPLSSAVHVTGTSWEKYPKVGPGKGTSIEKSPERRPNGLPGVTFWPHLMCSWHLFDRERRT